MINNKAFTNEELILQKRSIVQSILNSFRELMTTIDAESLNETEKVDIQCLN